MTQLSALALAAESGVAGTVLTGSLLLAVPLAALAGLVSFLSPCVLPLVPGYLSYVTGLTGEELSGRSAKVAVAQSPVVAGPPAAAIGGTGRPDERRAVSDPRAASAAESGRSGGRLRAVTRSRVVLGTVGFVAGFSAVFVSYGALFGGLGATLLEYQAVISRVLGLLVIVMGLGFLGWFDWLQREARWHPPAGLGVMGSPLLGVLFGLGWTPCIGPTLAAVQTLAFSQGSAARGAMLGLAYCAGLGLPFLAMGLAFERGLRAAGWVRRHTGWVVRIGGAMLVAIGLLQVLGLWGQLIVLVQAWVAGWEVVL